MPAPLRYSPSSWLAQSSQVCSVGAARVPQFCDGQRRGGDLLGRGLEGNKRDQTVPAQFGQPRGVGDERFASGPDHLHHRDRMGLVLTEQTHHVGVREQCFPMSGALLKDRKLRMDDPVGDTQFLGHVTQRAVRRDHRRSMPAWHPGACARIAGIAWQDSVVPLVTLQSPDGYQQGATGRLAGAEGVDGQRIAAVSDQPDTGFRDM